jgi:hypothetical protein
MSEIDPGRRRTIAMRKAGFRGAPDRISRNADWRGDCRNRFRITTSGAGNAKDQGKHMEMKAMKMGAAVILLTLCGCAGIGRGGNLVERFDERGVSAPALKVEAGGVLQFVNADTRPHQVYSNDCNELSSTVLQPGEGYSAQVGPGDKLCHFQDLLAPQSSSYSGTLQVHDADEERRRETAD